MMKNQSQHKRSVILAATAASLVMLTYGTGYRLLTGRPPPPGDVTSEDLAKLPLQLGNWAGREEPLSDEVIEATDTDAHLSRTYLRRNPPESVRLFIGYGVTPTDLAPHRPEVCYVGAGRDLIRRSDVRLDLDDGIKLPCNVLQFSPGGRDNNGVVVLDFYIIDGQYYADVSAVRKMAWRALFRLKDVDHIVQVQIAVSAAHQRADEARKSVTDFAVESASEIYRLFQSTQEIACSGEGLVHDCNESTMSGEEE
ncbi:MAG: exosortase C-terminal domain/associated protein EpsI [Planctomycetota bacterium]|jgi:EpsI family protein